MGLLKRPESVLVVVYCRAGAVLLMERTQPHGFWQSVTGSLQWAETPPAAAYRELREETGLAPYRLRDLRRTVRFPIRGPWRSRYAEDAHWNREHWFSLELPSPRMICVDPDEHRQYRWLPWQEAWRRATSYTNRDCIRAIFSA
jgi:dihydroneopterin triphosphate diphosphatase